MVNIKRAINQQDLWIVDLHFAKYEYISQKLKFRIASARHNFKWMKILID